MIPAEIRERLITLHRWTALALLPVYAALLITGAILALKPIGDGSPKRRTASVPADALIALVTRLQGQGEIKAISVALDGRSATVTVGKQPLTFDLPSGEARPSPVPARAPGAGGGAAARPKDKYAIPREIHIRLWFGAGFLVSAGTLAMLLLVVLGPFLSPPRWRNTALGWHTSAGWVLFPLLLFLPLTGAAIVLPFGHANRELLRPTNTLATPLSVAEGLRIGARTIDLTEVRTVSVSPNGRVVIGTQGRVLPEVWVVSPDGAEKLGSTAFNMAVMLHKGSWLGAWSGFFNLAGAIGLFGLLCTGTWSWVRRWRLRRRSAHRIKVATADNFQDKVVP